MKKIIFTENAPKAIGPYSQATSFENLIFTSGQLPINPKTNAFVPGGIAEQTRMSLENVKAILLEAGSDISKVLKTTVYLSDINNFAGMNEVYKEIFGVDNFPSRSAFEVANLPLGALVEIEVIAIK